MLITALTPNLDAFLFVETEDEHRTKTRHPVVLFVAMAAADGSNSALAPVALIDGKLVIGGKRIIRDET